MASLLECLPVCFLKEITNDFSAERELYRSVFGIVYKGILPDGTMIAVNRLAENAPVAPGKIFHTEITNRMALQHENIVELVSFCHEAQKKVIEHKGRYLIADMTETCLCYKYLPKGSLDKYLYADTGSINWDTRFKIIKGICQGLYFLHEKWKVRLIHMNLVPSSIWLDDNWVPKIADFGLSRLFGQEQTRMYTINVTGQNGYIAPEYLYKGEISTMSDIYSLGMLILEITTGEKNSSVSEDKSARKFVDKVHKHWTTDEKIKCNYPLLDLNDLQQVKACIVIGLKCVEANRNERPSIVDIVNMLNGKRVPIFDQLSCIFEKKIKRAKLTGIEEAVNELMKILTEGKVEQGKIVSIVGLGGLGKITLAHAIYGKLRVQFDCYAFVSVSRNPDMKKLLKCMLYQLGKKSNANIREGILDERLLIYELIEFLQKRRYERITNQCIPM